MIKDGKCTLNGKHENHAKPKTELGLLKEEIRRSGPCESTRMIKKRIVTK